LSKAHRKSRDANEKKKMGLEGEKNTGRGYCHYYFPINQQSEKWSNGECTCSRDYKTTTEDLAAEDAGFIYKKETANPNDTLVISSNLWEIWPGWMKVLYSNKKKNEVNDPHSSLVLL
jgi:hypothetical protein